MDFSKVSFENYHFSNVFHEINLQTYFKLIIIKNRAV